MPAGNQTRRLMRQELDALRTAPLKSEEEVAQEVRVYLEEKRDSMYSGLLSGKPGREHKAGGVR